MYKALVKHGVKKVCLCFDGDQPGLDGIKKTIKFFESHPDIKASVKIIPDLLDPDDYIKKYDGESFKKLEERTIFKYQLDNLKTCQDDLIKDEIRLSLFEILSNTKHQVDASQMINIMCEDLNVPKKDILSDLKSHEAKKSIKNDDVSVSDLLVEETSLLHQIESFEEKSLRSGKLLGISTGFPILDEKLDGLQVGLMLLCGKWNVGKSAFMQNIAVHLLKNPDVVIGYFSIDDSVVGKTIPRFI